MCLGESSVELAKLMNTTISLKQDWNTINKELGGFYETLQNKLSLVEQENKHIKDKYQILEKDFLFNINLINERDGDLKVQEREITNLLGTIQELQTALTKVKQERDVAAKANSNFRLEVENIHIEFREQTRQINRDWQMKLDGKDHALLAVREECEREKIEILARIDVEKQRASHIESRALLEIDQLQKQHLLDLKTLQKRYNEESLALSNSNAVLSSQFGYLEKSKLASDEELQLALSNNRELENQVYQLKLESSDFRKEAAAKASELEAVIQALTTNLDQNKQNWEIERKGFESEFQLAETTHSWQQEQLQGRLITVQDLVSSLSREKEELKNDLLHSDLQHRSQIEEKNSLIKSLQLDIEQAVRDKDRQIQECIYELERHKDQLKKATENASELEIEGISHLDEIRKLHQEIKELQQLDADVAVRYDQEHFLVESRYEHEIKRMYKDFEAAIKEAGDEKKVLQTEIKLMRARMTELDSANILLDQENRQLEDIIRQMRTDMENITVPPPNSHSDAILSPPTSIPVPKPAAARELKQQVPPDTPLPITLHNSAVERELREKLGEAVAELEVSLKERARLVEISNGLRACIKKPPSKNASTQAYPAPVVATHSGLSGAAGASRRQVSSTTTAISAAPALSADQLRKTLIKKSGIRNYNEK